MVSYLVRADTPQEALEFTKQLVGVKDPAAPITNITLGESSVYEPPEATDF